jgi:hypothetical protein
MTALRSNSLQTISGKRVDRPGNRTGQLSAQELPHRSKFVSDRFPRLAI